MTKKIKFKQKKFMIENLAFKSELLKVLLFFAKQRAVTVVTRTVRTSQSKEGRSLTWMRRPPTR